MTAVPYGCVTTREAARRRGVTRQAIDSLIKRGRLASVWDGKRHWVSTADLDALAAPPPEGWLSIEEVVRVSSTSRYSVDQACLPRVLINGRYYYERVAALAWAKNVAPKLRRRRGHALFHGGGR